jgi:Sec-independent protein translocase protein TatA
MFGGLFQPLHPFLILIIALIAFGPSRLPQLRSGFSKGLMELKRVLSQEKRIQMPPAAAAQVKKITKIIGKNIAFILF